MIHACFRLEVLSQWPPSPPGRERRRSSFAVKKEGAGFALKGSRKETDVCRRSGCCRSDGSVRSPSNGICKRSSFAFEAEGGGFVEVYRPSVGLVRSPPDGKRRRSSVAFEEEGFASAPLGVQADEAGWTPVGRQVEAAPPPSPDVF